MPLRAASTRTLRARASAITAEAVALMTAVTPPLWAYSRVPLGIGGSLWGRRGAGIRYSGAVRAATRAVYAPRCLVFFSVRSNRCDWYFLVRRGQARERRQIGRAASRERVCQYG